MVVECGNRSIGISLSVSGYYTYMCIAHVYGIMLLSGKNYLLVSENLSENSFLTVRTYCSTFYILDIILYNMYYVCANNIIYTL